MHQGWLLTRELTVVIIIVKKWCLFCYSLSGIYRGTDPLEHTSSHFAAFFLTSIVMVFAAYVIYHNRQKVVYGIALFILVCNRDVTPLNACSTAVKRLGQVSVLFREILFTMNWKHEQGCITIAVECKCIPIFLT